MEIITILGVFAGILTATANFPQALRTIERRKTKDISLGYYIMLTTGVFLWVIYGILIKNFLIIFANAVTSIPVTTILVMKIKYG